MKILSLAKANQIIDLAALRVVEYVIPNDLHNITLGVSSGGDSSAAMVILERARKIFALRQYPIEIVYVFIDIHSSPSSLRKARLLARKLKVQLLEDDATAWADTCPWIVRYLSNLSDEDFRRLRGNFWCRLRMILLYMLAAKYKGLVMGTGRLDEHYQGFWTIHGDVGNIECLITFPKLEIQDICEAGGVPAEIYDAPSSDDLQVTVENTAQSQLKLPYPMIILILSWMAEFEFDLNRDDGQLTNKDFLNKMAFIAVELKQSPDDVFKVVSRAVTSRFKRFIVDGPTLITREEVGLPSFGSAAFRLLYRDAVRRLYHI